MSTYQDTNDLIHEGIATHASATNLILFILPDTNDLIHEGIATTLLQYSVTLIIFYDTNDLIHEGIATLMTSRSSMYAFKLFMTPTT